MSELTKKAAVKAYNAGGFLVRADAADMPPEALADPIAACPFPVGDPQRAEWLKGLEDALEQAPAVDPEALKKAVADASS